MILQILLPLLRREQGADQRAADESEDAAGEQLDQDGVRPETGRVEDGVVGELGEVGVVEDEPLSVLRDGFIDDGEHEEGRTADD